MDRFTPPAPPIEGGCQCGAVRYRITAMPIVFYLCHCSECQRQTSSAFGESLRLRAETLEIEGSLKIVTRRSDAGRLREGHFCPSCGVRIFHGTRDSPEINIKAGTLDDTSWLVPAGHIWTRSRQRFIRLETDALCYEGQPTDGYAALAERWREMGSQSG